MATTMGKTSNLQMHIEIIFLMVFLSTPVLYIQYFILGSHALNQAGIKVLMMLYSGVLLTSMLTRFNKRMGFWLLFILSLFYFLYSLYIIAYHSLVLNGVVNVAGAWLYNFSLGITFLPILICLLLSTYPGHQVNHSVMSNNLGSVKKNNILYIETPVRIDGISRIMSLALYVSVSLACFGILQFIQGESLLPASISALLEEGDYVKFDAILGVYRAGSLYKSPLEFGLYSAFFVAVCLNGFRLTRKFYLVVFSIILAAGTIVTFSRTAILVMLLTVVLMVLVDRSLRKWIFALFLPFAFIVGLMLFSDNAQLFAPENLYIRFEIWTDLLSRLSKYSSTILFGLGIIQNGSYGNYNVEIIDNTYLGLLLLGGVVLFTTFVVLHFSIILMFIRTARTQWRTSFYYIPCAAFALSFLVGAITENTMHIFYFLYFPLMLSVAHWRSMNSY